MSDSDPANARDLPEATEHLRVLLEDFKAMTYQPSNRDAQYRVQGSVESCFSKETEMAREDAGKELIQFQDVKADYLRSSASKGKDRELDDLDLPKLPDVRAESLELCDKLGVRSRASIIRQDLLMAEIEGR